MALPGNTITLTELINSDVRYSSLNMRLSRFEKGSPNYMKCLYQSMPLAKWINYKNYLKSQSVPLLALGHGETYSSVFRNSLSPNHLIYAIDSTLLTGFDLFEMAVSLYPDNDCLGERIFDPITKKWDETYTFESYKHVQKRCRDFGSGIMTLVNIKRNKSFSSNDFIVSILSSNRKEWIIADLACQSFSLCNTALYETLGPYTSEYILNLTESPVIVLSKEHLCTIITLLPKLVHLNTIIIMDDLDPSEIIQFNDVLLSIKHNTKGEMISILSMKQVENIGRLNHVDIIPPKPDTLFTISFTSGTTNLPKGVELNHSHLSAGMVFTLTNFKVPRHKLGKQLYDLCFLPLAHIFQREIAIYNLSRGVALGFLHKNDPKVLVDDLRILKPDFLSVVPRILTRFESSIKNSLNSQETSTITKNIAHNILDAKQLRFTLRGGPDRSLMNSLVFHRLLIDRIRNKLGVSNADFFVIGSAPISPDTLLFMKSALDIGIRQGYGLTETFAGFSISESHECDAGSCGPTGVSCEVRLKSVLEMGYNAHDLKGELQVRGPQVFKKYFKNPDETCNAKDSDEWFSTGDIGYIDNKGRIHIIDRLKNFFKLAQGEYIAPEKIENNYLSCPYITQIFIYGDSLKTYLVGIVDINVDFLRSIVSKEIIEAETLSSEQLIILINNNTKIKRSILIIINNYTKGLQGFEKLHNISIAMEPLKLKDDTITPTFKVKRVKCTKLFQKTLDALYQEGSLIKPQKL